MTRITAWQQALASSLEHHAATYVATVQAMRIFLNKKIIECGVLQVKA